MEKNYLNMILVSGLILLAVFLAVYPNLKTKSIGVEEEKSRISVSGASSVSVEPNKAEVFVKIITLEKTAQESKNKNGRISANVMDALKKEGVKEKDIETSQFFISPKYEYEEVIENNIRKSKQILVGYEVTNVLKVTTQDLEKVGKLIDVSVDTGVNEIERISFGLTKEKEREIKQQAMILASNDAKDKAIALSTNLGVAILKPISISESSFIYQPFDIYPRGVSFEKAAPAETVISPQKLEVSASVGLVYEIK